MFISEFIDSKQKIIAILKTMQHGYAEKHDYKMPMASFLFQLNNSGMPMDYDNFTNIYNSVPDLQNIITQFNQDEVVFAGGEESVDSAPVGDIPADEKVDQMAMRAAKARESVDDVEEKADFVKDKDLPNLRKPKKTTRFELDKELRKKSKKEDVNEQTLYENVSHKLLQESWQQLTESQKHHVTLWETNVWPLYKQFNRLMEAELTAAQIQAIFQNAEKVSIDSGQNRTALGKAGKLTADVTSKMKAEIEKLLKSAQDSGPVKNFDQQFEKLKTQLRKQLQGNPAGQKILKGVNAWGDFAKENPGKSAFIIGATTSILAFASGGILGGAAIGFFLKLANNTIKGDQLSTAVAKSVKGAAVGAIAGGLGDIIADTAEDMFPAEITNIFINNDGAIDISQIAGMSASSLEDLDPESAMELIQTFTAMEEMLPRITGAEAKEALTQQYNAVAEKISELGDGSTLQASIDAIQDKFGIEGTGVDVKVATNTADPDSVGQVVSSFSAEELNDQFSIDASEFPRSGWMDDNKEELLKLGMTEEDFEAFQEAQKLDRAIDQANYREGQNISAGTSLKTIMGATPAVEGEFPDSIEAGKTFEETIEVRLPGSDKTWSAMSTIKVQGVDADGNAVFSIEKVSVFPEVYDSNLFDALEKLKDANPDNPIIQDFMKEVTKTQTASMETLKDDFAQNMAEKIMQGAAAVAVGAALAKTEVKPADNNTKESKTFEHLFALYEQEKLQEIDVKAIAKKAAAGAAKIGSAAAKKAGVALDKTGAVAQKGLAKAAQGAKAVGKELGQKITYKKLDALWKKAGSPSDAGQIANILSQAGMSDEQIGIVAKDQNTELKPTPTKAATPPKPAKPGAPAPAATPAKPAKPGAPTPAATAQAKPGAPAQASTAATPAKPGAPAQASTAAAPAKPGAPAPANTTAAPAKPGLVKKAAAGAAKVAGKAAVGIAKAAGSAIAKGAKAAVAKVGQKAAAPAKPGAPAPTAKPGTIVKSKAGNDVVAGVDGKPTATKPTDAAGIAKIKAAAKKAGVSTESMERKWQIYKKAS